MIKNPVTACDYTNGNPALPEAESKKNLTVTDGSATENASGLDWRKDMQDALEEFPVNLADIPDASKKLKEEQRKQEETEKEIEKRLALRDTIAGEVGQYSKSQMVLLKGIFARKYKDFGITQGFIMDVWKECQKPDDGEDEDRELQKFEMEATPCEEPVDPGALMEELEACLRKFIVFRDDVYQPYACALWVLATYCVRWFNYAPYLMITAPEKRCGKSQLLGLLANLSCRPLETGNLTAPVLFRLAQKHHPTIFIDEVDSFLAKDEDLQGVIKCGIEKGKSLVWRLEKQADGSFKEKRFDCFGFKAMAGISAKNISDTIADRCIIIELRRKLTTETMPKVRNEPSNHWDKLNSWCARFAEDYGDKWLDGYRPKIPDSIDDRSSDKWEPLIAVADCVDEHASENGKPACYGDKARKAAEILSNADKDMPLKIELLSDIRNIFNDPATPGLRPEYKYILSRDLASALSNNPDLRWNTYNRGKELHPKQLAGKLEDFGIKAKSVRRENNRMAYFIDDFKDAFIRYL